MKTESIYLDNHATTRCDPAVVEAMVPLMIEAYGNAHSPHQPGITARHHVEAARQKIAQTIGAVAEEIVFTSGATEANNLAIFGVALHPRQRRRHIVTVATEHPAVLDPCQQLEQEGFRITRLAVDPLGSACPGAIDLQQLADAVDEDTCLVSVMAANNEIGTLADLAPIAEICHRHGALLHTDATQAVGKLPLAVDELNVDLLSSSGHKIYGPKGVGFLFVRQRQRRVRLRPRIWGGGQQGGLRSGTINVPGVVGMAQALEIAGALAETERQRIAQLTARLWERLWEALPDIQLNGPPLDRGQRLLGNLNVCFPGVEGEALMSAEPRLAVSSGAACSTVDPAPSHVLLAIGLDESAARRSLRFGVGRFTTADEIELAADWLTAAHGRLTTRYQR